MIYLQNKRNKKILKVIEDVIKDPIPTNDYWWKKIYSALQINNQQ